VETEQVRDRKLVVAGLITAADGRVLITQRPPGGALAGFWELPGGKIEPGEGPRDALRRELEEEIDCQVEVGLIWDVLFHRYPEFDLLMLVFHCRLSRGQTPNCREVADLAWCLPEAISGYEILPADAPLVDRLVAEGLPPWPSS
jgi:8-oxo-dGTP diphosphatase